MKFCPYLGLRRYFRIIFAVITNKMNFSRQLLSWYLKNKRELPWRQTKDPYLIWLSEIIMQQTRIDQGLPYYEKFVRTWPTITKLAQAEEQEVLKLWQGLGYYSRARNLHETARMIVEIYGGRFPDTYISLLGLKGVGEYTAAAIASIVFGLPHPVVDGNVIRFLARYYGISGPCGLPATKRKIHDLATENIDHQHPGDFNQAMMEFGATVCTPANPDCTGCTFRISCVALARNLVQRLPERAAKPPLRDRFLHYFVVTFDDNSETHIFLNKRTEKDIWKNLYDFPQSERIDGMNENQPLDEKEFREFFKSEDPVFLGVSVTYIHQLTHQKLHVRFYRFHSVERIELPFITVPMNEFNNYPVPRLIERYLSENQV